MRYFILYLLILFSAPCCAATYKLVTDASELQDGDVIIIGADNDLVMSSMQSKNKSSFFTDNSFSYNNNIFNPLTSTIEFTLDASNDCWYLKAGNSYLASMSSPSSDKSFTLVSSTSVKGYFTKANINIDASTHYASIVFSNKSNKLEICLSDYPSFKCMSSPSRKTVKIYKKVDERPSLVGCSEYCNNEKALVEWTNQTKDITLYRSFVADGGYYSLCLPFEVSQEQLKNVFGASTEAFSFANASTANGEYNVYLSAETGTLTAGTPYIIKPSQNAINPVFNNVFIKASAGIAVTKNQVSFYGILDPFTMSNKNMFQRFLGGNDGLTLLYPNAGAAIYPTRAYFVFPSESNAKIGFSNDTPTGLNQVNVHPNTDNSYFTLDGRMLENKPTHGGIYIVDGHKVILHKR